MTDTRPEPGDDLAGGEFLSLVHGALRRVRRDAQERLEPAGITPGQLRLLRALARADRPQRLRDIADALDVVPRSVTSKVDVAEQEGLVRKMPDPADRRATRVELTADGRALLDRASRLRGEQADDLLSSLSADERAELLRLLRVVARDAVACDRT